MIQKEYGESMQTSKYKNLLLLSPNKMVIEKIPITNTLLFIEFIFFLFSTKLIKEYTI